MRVELMDCERVLLDEIADSRMKREDVALTYAMAMRSSESVDWSKVNHAIMERWSMSALKWIKDASVEALMPDTPATKRAATCPTCGSDDWRFDGCDGEKIIRSARPNEVRCPDPFHSAHPVSAGGERVECNDACDTAVRLRAQIAELQRHIWSIEDGAAEAEKWMMGEYDNPVEAWRAWAADRERLDALTAENKRLRGAIEGEIEDLEYAVKGAGPSKDDPTVALARDVITELRFFLTPKHPQDEEQ